MGSVAWVLPTWDSNVALVARVKSQRVPLTVPVAVSAWPYLASFVLFRGATVEREWR